MRCPAHGGIKPHCVCPTRISRIYIQQNHDLGFAAFELHVGVILDAILFVGRDRTRNDLEISNIQAFSNGCVIRCVCSEDYDLVYGNMLLLSQPFQLGREHFVTIAREFTDSHPIRRGIGALRIVRSIRLHRLKNLSGIPTILFEHDLKRTEVGKRQLIVEDVLFGIAEDKKLAVLHMEQRNHVPGLFCEVLPLIHDYGVEAEVGMVVEENK